MKIQEPDFPPEVHPTIRDFASDVFTLLRAGGVEFQLISSAPTDTPDVETAFRIEGEAGTGNVYLWIWNRTTATWRGIQATVTP